MDGGCGGAESAAPADLVICGVVFVVALAVAVQGLGYLTAFTLVS